MNSLTSFLLLLVLLSTTTLSIASRPESSGYFSGKSNKGSNGGFFGNIPGGGGFGIPGFGNGWGNGGGYGGGYGSPKGGHNRNGVITPSIVCQQKGPCYMKKLTCPAKCFHSSSHSGKGYGGGGGGGGCTMDCQKRCVAYC